MHADPLLEELPAIGTLLCNEALARHTTFGIGGAAEYYLKVPSREALRAAVVLGGRYRVPWLILGSGSNVLVGDGGLRGLVIENQARAVEGSLQDGNDPTLLRVDSGVSLAAFARRCCRAGYWGLEWAVGIPGTLGGAVVYNAGAYGGCLADVLQGIEVADAEGRINSLPAEALALEYRGSGFTRGLLRGLAVLSVTLRLRRGRREAIMQRVAELDGKRKAAQPPGRNAGSIFKNPGANDLGVKSHDTNLASKPAWWYIDQVGLRGAQLGDAEISVKHANFFMNRGKARAADVKALMDQAVVRVHARFGVELIPEVALIGEGFEREMNAQPEIRQGATR